MPKGKQQGAQQQSLFLLYLDAVSITNSKRAVQQGALPAPAAAAAGLGGGPQPQPGQEQGQQQPQPLEALPPNVPDFTVRDLVFVLKFIGAFGGLELLLAQGGMLGVHLLSCLCLHSPSTALVCLLRQTKQQQQKQPCARHCSAPLITTHPPTATTHHRTHHTHQRSTKAMCSGSWCTRSAPPSTATRWSRRGCCWR